MLIGNSNATREVAVFRIAESLGIKGVPVSTMRAVPLRFLTDLIKRKNPIEAEDLSKAARTDEKGNIIGAAMQWINGLNYSGIDALGGMEGVENRVFPARPLRYEMPLAAQISNMMVLDYLVGNWDRFSGGNIYVTKDGKLVLLDHNSTFAPWSDKQKEKMANLLNRQERYSSSLIERLKKLNSEGIQNALSKEPWHANNSLISNEDIFLILERRDQLIGHINDLLQRHPKEAVLPFP